MVMLSIKSEYTYKIIKNNEKSKQRKVLLTAAGSFLLTLSDWEGVDGIQWCMCYIAYELYILYLVYIGVYGINIGDLSTHFYANIYSSFSFSQMIIDILLIFSPLSEQLFWFTFAWMNSDFLRSISWKTVDEDYICIKHILPGCHPTRADQTKSTKRSSRALLL